MKELHQIVREGLDKINGIFGDKAEIETTINKKGFVNDFVSSQISLLEEVIKYAYSQMQDEHPVDCIDGETPVETYGYEATHNQALKTVISYLQDQINKIKEL